MKRIGGFLFIILFFSCLSGQHIPTQKILESFVEDFRTDPAAKERAITFGIKIKEKGDWHVIIDGKGSVELKKGMPAIPSLYYITDYKTLLMIYQGHMSALSAMGRAGISDQTPMNFGKDTLSRFIHGAQAKILYYEKGLRSSWYQIKKGQHINADPEDQKNPFPTLIIMIKGEAKARIGGKLIKLKKGTCLHIPTGVTHEFWNDKQESVEFIIVMFGEGA